MNNSYTVSNDDLQKSICTVNGTFDDWGHFVNLAFDIFGLRPAFLHSYNSYGVIFASETEKRLGILAYQMDIGEA